MVLNDRLADGETKASPWLLRALIGCIRLGEAVENVIVKRERHSRPLIGHRDSGPLAVQVTFDANGLVGGAVLDGVRDQIGEHLRHPVTVQVGPNPSLQSTKIESDPEPLRIA